MARKVFSVESLRDGTALRHCQRLFLLTVLLLILQQVLEGMVGRVLLGIVFVAVIGQGVIALLDDPRHRRIGSALGALAAVSMIVQVLYLPRDGALQIAVPLVLLMFSGYVTWRLLYFVISAAADSRTKLSAALSAYLHAGLTFGMAYVALHLLDDEAFGGALVESIGAGANTDPVADRSFRIFTYYSFVTLTTLGYGDIVPVSPWARILAMLESVGGVLYVAVMVAALVGRVQWGQSEGTPDEGDQPPS